MPYERILCNISHEDSLAKKIYCVSSVSEQFPYSGIILYITYPVDFLVFFPHVYTSSLGGPSW